MNSALHTHTPLIKNEKENQKHTRNVHIFVNQLLTNYTVLLHIITQRYDVNANTTLNKTVWVCAQSWGFSPFQFVFLATKSEREREKDWQWKRETGKRREGWADAGGVNARGLIHLGQHNVFYKSDWKYLHWYPWWHMKTTLANSGSGNAPV